VSKEFNILDFKKSLLFFLIPLCPILIIIFSTKVIDPFIPLKVWTITQFSAMILLYFAILIFKYRNSPLILKINKIDLFILLFIVYNFLSIFWSISLVLSLLSTSILISILTFYIAIRFAHISIYAQIKRVLIFTSIPVLIYGYLQFFYLEPFFVVNESYGINRIISTLGNKNYLAYFLGIMIFMITPLLLTKKKNYKLSSFLYISTLTLLFLTTCRGAILALLIIYPLYICRISKIKRVKKLFSKIGSLILISIFLYLLLVNFNSEHIKPLKAEFSILKNEKNIHMRIEIFKVGLLSFLDYPILGTGVNSFSQIFFHKKEELINENKLVSNNYIFVKNSHNEIIQIMVENGLVGLFLFLVILYLIIKLGKKLRDEFYILLFLSFSSLYSFPLRVLPISIIFLLIVARIASISKTTISIKLAIDKSYAIGYTLLIISIFQFFYGNSNLLSSFYLREADNSLKLKNSKLYEENLKKSLYINKFNENARFRLANFELDMGRNNSAFYNFTKLNYRRKDPSVSYNIALSLMFMGYYKDSLYIFKNIYSLVRKKELILLNVGVLYEKMGNYKLAKYYYYKSFYEKENIGSLINLINLCKEKKSLYSIFNLYENSKFIINSSIKNRFSIKFKSFK